MKKRLLSIFMALVMVFTLLPVTVAAEDGTDIPPADGGVVENPVEPIDGDGEDGDEGDEPVVSYALLTVVLKGDQGELLKGGKFVLKNSADEVLKEWVTDDKGEFLLDYYVDGTYKLYQTEAPAHFTFGEYVEFDVIVSESGAKLSLQPYNGNESATEVTADVPVAYSVKNIRKQGSITVSVSNEYMENGVAVTEVHWIENIDAAEYEVKLTVTPLFGEALNGTYGDATFTDNEAVLMMKAGYSLSVSGIPAGFGYAVSVKNDGSTFVSTVNGEEGVFSAAGTAVTVTNLYEYRTHNEGFHAVWVDALAPDTYPAGKLTVYSDAECATPVAELTPDANGKIHLDIAAAGSYYLKETTTPEGYHGNSEVYTITAKEETIVINGYTEQRMVVRAEELNGTVAETGVDEAYADMVYTIVSTPIQPVTVSIQVAWIAPDGYTNHPESVDVQLLRNGVAYGNPVTLSAENNWKTSWSGADITDNYAWTPVQVAVPEGYSEGYVSDGYAYTVENELIYSNVTVSASVSWLNPKDYTQQPVSAKLTLYRDGVAYDSVTVSESGKWVHRWQNMPDCFDWTVDEPVVPSGYKKKITHVGNSWVIVNAHEEIPLTGDDSNVWLWAGAAGVATVGLAITLIVLLKKRKAEENQDEE